MLDQITFEILRHRLWAINDEAAATLSLISGSPVANEVFDFNTALLTGDGEVFIIGPYIAIHAISLEDVVKDILAEYKDNPGIGEDDMFLCNDPYVGAMHQNDVTLVAPVHWEGELIAWTGCAVHQVDVGGPGKGQVNVNATSIYEEAPLIPPSKIVDKGILRKDLEREYLRRSRLPGLLALDLRAMIAANNVSKKRIKELIGKWGVQTVKGVIGETINYTEMRLKRRLRELPDGTWRHISYLDYGGNIFPVHLTMNKKQHNLVFDFAETADQAPAVINCTYAGLRAGLLATLLAYLCYDIPWCPSGAMRVVGIVSQPGSVIHARWPGGVCKATTAGIWAVVNACSACVAKMLAASDTYCQRSMALWKSSTIVEELFGINQRGEVFGGSILDFMAGGGGARSYKDGIDTGGSLIIISSSLANAETYEYRYPLLYLCRKQQIDSGGPGKFRGGASLTTMYITHDVAEIPHKIIHSLGVEQPDSVGICGGYPGGTNKVAIKRNTNILNLLREGRLPESLDELAGEMEIPQPIVATYQKKGDVCHATGVGGGGYGDPVERAPELVHQDIRNHLVSVKCAEEIYGVIIDPATKGLDKEKTPKRRLQIRQERIDKLELKDSQRVTKGPGKRRLSEYLRIINGPNGRLIQCRCGHYIAPINKNYKDFVIKRELALSAAGPQVNTFHIGGDKFVFRQFCCPECGTLLDTEIALKGSPLLWDVHLQMADS